MLGVADLQTPEAVAAAESTISCCEPAIPLAASRSKQILKVAMMMTTRMMKMKALAMIVMMEMTVTSLCLLFKNLFLVKIIHEVMKN